VRMLDAEGDRSVYQLQLYLTPGEAGELRVGLDRLLVNPERGQRTSASLRGRLGARALAVTGYASEVRRPKRLHCG